MPSDSLITEISDIDLTESYIYITTNNGVYKGDLSLKLTENYHRQQEDVVLIHTNLN